MSRKGGPHLRPEDPDMKFNDAQKEKLRQYDQAVAAEEVCRRQVGEIVRELGELGVSTLDLLEAAR